MTKRQQASILTYVGLALGIVAIAINRSPEVAQWIEQRLPPELAFETLFWILLGTAVALSLLSRVIWKCPHCGQTPGPVTAKRCKACGKPLDESEPAGNDYSDLGRVAPTAAAIAPPPLDPLKVESFRKAVARIVWVRRFFGWKYTTLIALLVGAVAAIAAKIAMSGKKDSWDAAGIAMFAVSLMVWVLLIYVGRFARMTVLIGLKCPGCKKSLVNNLSQFCPHCGAEIPLIEATTDRAALGRSGVI